MTPKVPKKKPRFTLPVPQSGNGNLAAIDEDLLEALCETMLPIESVAMILGCHRDTLYARFSDKMQKAREGRKQTLHMAMWEKALIEKNTTMQIWLSKQHLGFRDQIPEEATVINFNVNIIEVPK